MREVLLLSIQIQQIQMSNHVFDIVVLTEDRYVNPDPNDPYNQDILNEDRLVVEALEAKGFRVARISWSDPTFDWSSTQTVIFRTTWDYFYRFQEWEAWLSSTSKVTQMINSHSLIQWNMDKHYLRDLEERGIHIPESRFIEVGEQTTLSDLLSETGWANCILKPCVSGTARHTYKLNAENISEHEDIFQGLIRSEAMMLQPFLNNIVAKGEVSMIVIGGQFTHAVLKVAKGGDFRVQSDFGGSIQNYNPSVAEREFAEKAVAACDPQPVYARVDIVEDNNGQLALIELELIEPELWFRMNPKAAEVLADSLERFL